LKKQKRNL